MNHRRGDEAATKVPLSFLDDHARRRIPVIGLGADHHDDVTRRLDSWAARRGPKPKRGCFMGLPERNHHGCGRRWVQKHAL